MYVTLAELEFIYKIEEAIAMYRSVILSPVALMAHAVFVIWKHAMQFWLVALWHQHNQHGLVVNY